jgi:hypothetical protein
LEYDGVPGAGGGKAADRDVAEPGTKLKLPLIDPPGVREWYKEEGRELEKDALGFGVPGVDVGIIGEPTDGEAIYGEVGAGENVDVTGVLA